eukprot:TRINITY_DN15000_c0_g1_i1.p1 TRINITY_DN15000_c0_g1~~TRINITY_DN15000_c0_g1_i1.p1  ORF type:complete len:696 (+),score=174.10 TRINITY_DN15000_c0_g1_i1:66-2090(+)
MEKPPEDETKKEEAKTEEEKKQERIARAIARCEAPIKPEFLLPEPSREKAAEDASMSKPEEQSNKRPAPTEEAGEEGADDNGGKDKNGKGGKGDGKGKGKKRQRGQNKAKDRSENVAAMKAVRAGQLCSRLAYLNCCDGATAAGNENVKGGGCKANHDVEAAKTAKMENISQECPVFKALGVCPAGLNCRFGGHEVDGKNVDKDGVALTPDSPWVTKVPGVGKPPGELNIIGFDVIQSLRKNTFDFSRSDAVLKSWQKFSSKGHAGEPEAPLGAVVMADRKPLDLFGKTVLAPLTTVGNLPYRRLCVKLGCEVTVGEMALARTCLEGGPAELALLRRHESEKCYGVQIAGGYVDDMTKVAQFIEDKVDCDFVDINCGCPLDEVHRRGAGSALMSRKNHLQGIVRCMSSVLTTKHLTLKLRTAHFEDKKADDFALFNGRTAHKLIPQIDSWGVSAITLHGRTARQRYTKLADWDYINECSVRRTEVQDQLSVKRTPLIACGDVISWEEAEEHMKVHGTHSIMIGRGALIKPWLFTEIKEKRHWDISANERFDQMKDFVNYGLEHWGSDARGVETTRRFLLEWLSFTCRYVPYGLLEQQPMKINWRPRPYIGRSDLETKLGSTSAKDWVEITEMLLGKVPEGFSFTPKHKSNSYEKPVDGTAAAGESHDQTVDPSG